MKAITIFFMILLVASLIFVIYNKEKTEKDLINIGDIEISSSNFKSITDPLPFGRYVICSLNEEDGDVLCVPMFKGKLDD